MPNNVLDRADLAKMLIMSSKDLLEMNTEHLSRDNRRKRLLMLLYLYIHCGDDDIAQSDIDELLFQEVYHTLGKQNYDAWMKVRIFEDGLDVNPFADEKV